MNKAFRVIRGQARNLGVVAAGAVGVVGSAMAEVTTYASPELAVAGIADTGTAIAPTLYGLAVVSTGIMIGIMWIKRGKRAA